MSKKNIIIILLVLILLIVSGIWYVKQSKAAKTFAYQNVIYNCEETGGAAAETGTVIKIAQTDGGIPVIVHEGKEYKCKISSDSESAAPDVVLDKDTDNVKLFISDNSGNEVEIKDGAIQIGADGNAVVVNEKGVSVKLGDGGIIEVSEDGDANVNVNVPGAGSVNIKGGNVKASVPGVGNVKTEGGKMEINTPETGTIKVDEDGGVSIPGVIDIPGGDIEY